ncbi:MAG: PaaI family thioesterase [Lachnospiraceae bacterium]|nr:PaaI family thioesterase [Lachnospiraceae bacterium]
MAEQNKEFDIEAFRKAFNEGNLFPKSIGARITVLREGYAEAELTLREDHQNFSGRVQGGVMLTLADCCAGAASRSYNVDIATLEMKYNFIRGITVKGQTIKAVTEVIHAGRKTHVLESRIYDSDGKLAGMATITNYVTGDLRK